MKAISIKEPWATLIIKGYKKYEFRSFKTKYRGDILVHASKVPDKEALKRFKYLNLEYNCGCILGKMCITDCIEADNNFKNKLISEDKIVYKSVNCGDYAWKVEDIEEYKNKIEVNGKLGLWEYKRVD